MGHVIEHRSYPENVDRAKVEAEWNYYVSMECWQEGSSGLANPIRWLGERPEHICDSYEEAEEYLSKHDKGWYDQLAVRYRDTVITDAPKSIIELRKRIANEQAKLTSYADAHSVLTFKAEYIGCPVCGSKLSRKHLSGNICPLCRAELRSKTTIETIDRYRSKIKKLQADLAAEETRLQQKMAKTAKIKWLVKIEYHS